MKIAEKGEVITMLERAPDLLHKLLINRGIHSQKDMDIFCNPDYDRDTHDANLLKNIDKAADRIISAIKNKERICVFSDYDTDGIPGAVVLHDLFKHIGYDNTTHYIPHRHEEGFGLNVKAIEKLSQDKVDLIITVDCGITGAVEVKKANELGIDVIITDHHEISGKIPDAYTIVNPRQKDDIYPNKDICGAALVYKLAEVVLERGNFDVSKDCMKWSLDMVGLATLSDMVPLVGENRAFAYFGLHVLRRARRIGISTLLQKAGISSEDLNEDDVGFTIAPRINAASRMDSPEDAFRLLSTDDEEEAELLVKHLTKLNNERKGLVASMVKEAHKKISKMDEIPDVIVLGNTHWRPGLVGLAANALVETYKKSVFLWGREGSNDIKGSCRSNGAVDLVELMNVAKSSFIESGGHTQSAGFSVKTGAIHTLEKDLNYAYKKLKKKKKKEDQDIDITLGIEEINWRTYGTIERLAPYGVGNPKPLIKFESVVPSEIKSFGKEKNHFEMTLEGGVKGIAFFKGGDDFSVTPQVGSSCDVIASLERSTFGRVPELRLRIVDIF